MSSRSEPLEFGLVLPTHTWGASREAIEAVSEAAEQQDWSTLWVTDNLLVDHAAAGRGHIFEALTTLAYVAGRTKTIRLGTSVLVVPHRNAVTLAKELATLDVLSDGRLVVGVGVGWNPLEFSNLGLDSVWARRGTYLDEGIRLWRHLWSGSDAPFAGRFHSISDFVFSPRPVQASIPIIVGGDSAAARRRAIRFGDGYLPSRVSPSAYTGIVDLLRTEAALQGRAAPPLGVRVRVHLGSVRASKVMIAGQRVDSDYLISGSDDVVAQALRDYAAVGIRHLAVDFDTVNEPDEMLEAMTHFRQVARQANESAGS